MVMKLALAIAAGLVAAGAAIYVFLCYGLHDGQPFPN
mgnify:CR=1 FL=1